MFNGEDTDYINNQYPKELDHDRHRAVIVVIFVAVSYCNYGREKAMTCMYIVGDKKLKAKREIGTTNKMTVLELRKQMYDEDDK